MLWLGLPSVLLFDFYTILEEKKQVVQGVDKLFSKNLADIRNCDERKSEKNACWHIAGRN
jgi:hypothetical protein